MQTLESSAGDLARSAHAAAPSRSTALPRTVAGCFSIAAFAVALLAGLAVDNPAPVILQRAIAVMVVCYPAGWIIGSIIDRVVRAHLVAHAVAHPAPLLPAPMPGSAESAPSNSEEVIVV